MIRIEDEEFGISSRVYSISMIYVQEMLQDVVQNAKVPITFENIVQRSLP